MANETQNTPDLQAQIDILMKRIETVEADNEVLRNANDKKNAEAAPPEPPKTPSDVFKVAGKKWKFIVPQLRLSVENGSQVITAVDALADEQLLAALVAVRSGCIVEVAK